MPVLTHGLTHLALSVDDLDRSVAFYEGAFGMRVVYRLETFIQLQTPDARDVLVLEKRPDAGKPGGVAHFGFRLVDPVDIDLAAESVVAAGGTILSKGEFCPGAPYLYAADPDGYEVEVWFEPPMPLDPR